MVKIYPHALEKRLFILEYHAGDPNGATWNKVLLDVISSVSVIPGGS